MKLNSIQKRVLGAIVRATQPTQFRDLFLVPRSGSFERTVEGTVLVPRFSHSTSVRMASTVRALERKGLVTVVNDCLHFRRLEVRPEWEALEAGGLS